MTESGPTKRTISIDLSEDEYQVLVEAAAAADIEPLDGWMSYCQLLCSEE